MTRDTRDMSELEQLRRERDEARAAQQAAFALLATISHELRTPLTCILGMTNLLLGTDLDEEQNEYARTVWSSAEHLLRLVSDVIDLSKLEAGALDLRPAPDSPAEVVRSVVDIVRPQANDKRLSLSWHIEADLEEPFLFDSARLRQVLLNLAGNAIKFTDRGTIQIDVATEPAGSGGRIAVFTVRDSGIGMDDAARSMLFQRFTRAGPVERRGAGLGLSISRQIVELMGGEIRVESTPGTGTVFRFTMPLVPAEAAPAPDKAPSVVDGDARALSLLLAEDNDLNQRYLEALLSKAGHRVIVVDDGMAAVQAVRACRFDAVLMDIRMPGMDGMQAIAAIRTLGTESASTPVIALTADVSADGDNERFLAAGFDAYVEKPVRSDLLAKALMRVTGNPVSIPDFTPTAPLMPPQRSAEARKAVDDLIAQIAAIETASS